ncbi:MerR family transcriptional regulator [Aquicoccus porphyridii]|uniref:MerR family transcriptional regulator n=1 Tax=Aquicoccus porphyridii TaxID=1852029 RepID=A0A5A9ZWI1_9RHOB|nr:helix-turn-helix domain-containing protein [Aquicoccus porphyridii]KAA0921132.1 MerR family transcriptional regulator [Aquicoccus porphyridii]RAI56333.1 MerR family transcriptional regulator [Rhodobacteraceae bacterium AsT-22]
MLDISELSRRTGFPASRLRYYEEIGLIRSSGRKGLKRLFEEDVTTRLALIALGQTAGFSLAEIRALIGVEGKPRLDRARLGQQADRLNAQIDELTVLRDGIRHIVNCSAENHLDCPRFRRIMRVAMKRRGAR